MLFNNREIIGMINISRKNHSKKVIGHFSMIPDFRIFLENYRQGGWDHMKSMKFIIMDTVTLVTIDGSGSPFLVNGHRL
jgi:hypothetical protein